MAATTAASRPSETLGTASSTGGRGGYPRPPGDVSASAVGVGGPAGAVGLQAVAEREQRVVVGVADVDRLLVERARPGHRQLAGERPAAEEHVGHALALAARQPGRDERVHLVKLRGVDD